MVSPRVFGFAVTGSALVALWPLWFPPAYYVGAYAYVLFLIRRGR